MAAYMALIERSNRKDIPNVEVQITITDLSPGRQTWRGEFVSRSADAILPNERLALTFDRGRRGLHGSVTPCSTVGLPTPLSSTLPVPADWPSQGAGVVRQPGLQCRR